jgi:hypothetical protein
MPKAYSGDLRVRVIEMVRADRGVFPCGQHRGQVAAAVGEGWQRGLVEF